MGSGGKQKNGGLLKVGFDHVILQIFKPHYALERAEFQDEIKNGDGPLLSGALFEPKPEMDQVDVLEGALVLNLFLN